jgi:hypothetical protein
MPAELGQQLYLFQTYPNAPVSQLVISAHGGIGRFAQRTFTVPDGVTLHFYSDHGEVTDDFGVHAFGVGGHPKQLKETITGGNPCYDYELTKYQTKKGESYDDIISAQQYVHEFNEMLAEAGSHAPSGSVPAQPFDVLTVRNRPAQLSTIRLSAVLAALPAGYTVVHCYFCRSFTLI